MRVRLLVDRLGSFQLRRDNFDSLVAAGGAMRWFNEPRLPSFSFRDHRKLLIVDGRLASGFRIGAHGRRSFLLTSHF